MNSNNSQKQNLYNFMTPSSVRKDSIKVTTSPDDYLDTFSPTPSRKWTHRDSLANQSLNHLRNDPDDNPVVKSFEFESQSNMFSNSSDSDDVNKKKTILNSTPNFKFPPRGSNDSNVETSSSPSSDYTIGSLSIHNLNYTIESKMKCRYHPSQITLLCKKQAQKLSVKPKMVLKNINAVFLKGSLNAIMGPSGCGKTSLLTICAHRRKPKGNISGLVLHDSRPLSHHFVKVSGFVTEGHVLMATMTVRENVMFSASLRMGKNISISDKRKAVQKILEKVELTQCADSMIGNELIKGVSSGEMKRCHIATELINNPHVLFLDEPTSGLDSAIAYSIVKLLKNIADTGCAVILSIHQPRFQIFKLFNSLTILSLGQIVYHGGRKFSLDYFSHIGYECEYHENPADFYLDIIHAENLQTIKMTEEQLTNGSLPNDPYLVRAYSGSQLCEQVKLKLNWIEANYWDRLKNPIINNFYATERAIRYESSFCEQFLLLGKRNLLNLYRNPAAIVTQAIVMVCYSIIVGTIYFQSNFSADFGIQNRVGALFFIMMNQVFGSLASIEIFIKEKPIYMYELSNRFYSVGSFYFAKILFDLIPMRILPVAIISAIGYWMIGLKPHASNFFTFMLTLSLLSISANSVALFAGIIGETIIIATNITGLFFIILMIFGGLFINVKSIVIGLSWIRYISIFRYGYNALLINEIKDVPFCNRAMANNITTPYCVQGNNYLTRQGILYEKRINLWSNHIALSGITISFLAISYCALLLQKWRYKH